MKIFDQSKSDLNLLNKYYLHLKSYNNQLNQSVLFKSQHYNEYINSRSISNQCTNFHNKLELEMKTNSNHAHSWNLSMITSSYQFNSESKLFLLKKKLVNKTNELVNLKRIFHEKEVLYRYSNQIYTRRQKLYEKMNKTNVL